MPASRNRTALLVSPHLDDVAFSCGGTAVRLRRSGWRVAVVTVFTASVARPTGFALACQLDKGLGPEVDYMAIRRREDAAFGQAVGAQGLHWLGLPEAPHRGYGSAPALFDEPLAADRVWETVADGLASLGRRVGADLILAPQGVGGHVDHRQVIRAIAGVPAFEGRTAWYRDLPYAARFPEARPDPGLPGGLREVAVALRGDDLTAKLDGCACYASQLGFQFGGEPAMRDRLGAFAAAEARRTGQETFDPWAETFLAPPELADVLASISPDRYDDC